MKNVFEDDTAAAAQALRQATAALADVEATRNALQSQLTADEGVVAQQNALIADWQKESDRQQELAETAQRTINQKTFALESLKTREPQPATEWVSNPAYLDWDQQVVELLEVLNAALAVLQPLQAAQDEAQRVVDVLKADEPEKFEPPEVPPGRPVIAQEWKDWLASLQQAQGRLSDATSAAKPARDAVAQARSDYDGLIASPPPQRIEQNTAPHQQWQQEVAKLNQEIATATTARDNALGEVRRLKGAIEAAYALRLGSQNRIDERRPQLAAATRDVATRKAAVDAARAAVAHVARWVAALAGAAPDAAAVGEVVVELLRRLTTAEDAAAAAGDEARRTEDTAWRMGQRADEIQRRRAVIATVKQALDDADKALDKADLAVANFLRQHSINL